MTQKNPDGILQAAGPGHWLSLTGYREEAIR